MMKKQLSLFLLLAAFLAAGGTNMEKMKTKDAYFAGGCFWGVEYQMEQAPGVLDAVSGYMGGMLKNPSYSQVSHENTGHVEAVRVRYDPSKISYETLARLFFEIHDPTQTDGQGPDRGDQYLSVAFYNDASEKKTLEKLVDILEKKGYKIATQIRKAVPFYPAEAYHQNYYKRKGSTPYCHVRMKRF